MKLLFIITTALPFPLSLFISCSYKKSNSELHDLTITKDSIITLKVEKKIIETNEKLYNDFDIATLTGIDEKMELDSLECIGVIDSGNTVNYKIYDRKQLAKSILFTKQKNEVSVLDNTPTSVDSCSCLRPTEKMYYSNGKLFTALYFNEHVGDFKYRLVGVNTQINKTKIYNTITPHYYFNKITFDVILKLLNPVKKIEKPLTKFIKRDTSLINKFKTGNSLLK